MYMPLPNTMVCLGYVWLEAGIADLSRLTSLQHVAAGSLVHWEPPSCVIGVIADAGSTSATANHDALVHKTGLPQAAETEVA